MLGSEYSFYFGFIPFLSIETISAYLFTGAVLLILTGIITSVTEIISIKKSLLFTAVASSVLMLLYLGFFGIIGIMLLPCIWLATHILIIQSNKG